MHRASAQFPDQPTVDRAKRQFAAFGHAASAFYMVQYPLQFGGRKIGVDQQARFVLHLVGVACLSQAQALRLSTPVLPNNGVVNRLSGVAAPNHRGFALVGDAHRSHRTGADPGLRQGLSGGGQLALPNFFGVVFDPAGLRVDLAKLRLRRRQDAAIRPENDASRTRGALVQGQ